MTAAGSATMAAPVEMIKAARGAWRKYLHCSKNDHAPARPWGARAVGSLRPRGLAGRGVLRRPDPRADRATNRTRIVGRGRVHRARASDQPRARLQRARRADGRTRWAAQAD